MQTAIQGAAQRAANRLKKSPSSRYELRGANLQLQHMTAPEILLCGPAGSGKSLADLLLCHNRMMAYPGARALIVRKVRADLAQSTLVTFERDILGFDNPICAGVQRSARESYRYPNGSEVVVGGMDRPGRILSAEYDLIIAAEAVQFSEEDWEFFVMRNRNGVIPFQQVIGDTNPDQPKHWLKQRCDAGLTQLINSYHKDNPAFWDTTANDGRGDWTDRGRQYVTVTLARLSGVRKQRYLENKWALAEGAVYDTWDENIHVIDGFPIPAHWRKFRVIDFGYTNPFVCQWWAVDEDNRLHLYREMYYSQRTVKQHAADILRLTAGVDKDEWQALTRQQQYERLSKGERIEATISDHDAEDRATLSENGIPTLPAKKEISVGIQAVQLRLATRGDGKPGVYLHRGALVEVDEALREAGLPICTQDEFSSYVWAKGVDGKPLKEVPLDLHNHGMDCVRYLVRHVDKGVGRVRKNPLYG